MHKINLQYFHMEFTIKFAYERLIISIEGSTATWHEHNKASNIIFYFPTPLVCV